jgi:hypothetical protein
MSLSSKGRARAYAGAALALTALSSACNKDKMLQVTDPDLLNIGDYNTPAGADPLRYGVMSLFTSAFDGGTDAFTVITGNMSDELLSSDTFDTRLTINARKSDEINSDMESTYRSVQRVRSQAETAIATITKTAPTPTFNRGQLYMYLGYSEVMLGEGWCAGVPFSSEDGATTTYGAQLPIDSVFKIAVVHFDSALALADTNTSVKYGASIGKGRALLSLAQYTAAAAAVAGVPQSYKLVSSHDANTSSNGMWSATTNGNTRYRLSTNEGTNGLPFLQTPADPRVPWAASTRQGFSGAFLNEPNNLKFGRYDDGVVANGIEAKLIGIEATLQGNTQASRQAVYDALNALRASGPPVVPQMTTGAPTTQDDAIKLFFKERAYWLWLTGHRLGDLRRLVRNYGYDPEAVFPTGNLTPPLSGTYGTSTSIHIPYGEKNNPNYQGCLDNGTDKPATRSF